MSSIQLQAEFCIEQAIAEFCRKQAFAEFEIEPVIAKFYVEQAIAGFCIEQAIANGSNCQQLPAITFATFTALQLHLQFICFPQS